MGAEGQGVEDKGRGPRAEGRGTKTPEEVVVTENKNNLKEKP